MSKSFHSPTSQQENWKFVSPNVLKCTSKNGIKRIGTLLFLQITPKRSVGGKHDQEQNILNFSLSFILANLSILLKSIIRKLSRWQSAFLRLNGPPQPKMTKYKKCQKFNFSYFHNRIAALSLTVYLLEPKKTENNKFCEIGKCLWRRYAFSDSSQNLVFCSWHH